MKVISIPIQIFSVIFLTLSITASAASSEFSSGIYAVGVNSIFVKDKQRNRKLIGRIWHPASLHTKQKQITYNNIFLGHRAKLKATIAEEPNRYSLLLFSHGSGGNYGNLSWRS